MSAAWLDHLERMPWVMALYRCGDLIGDLDRPPYTDARAHALAVVQRRACRIHRTMAAWAAEDWSPGSVAAWDRMERDEWADTGTPGVEVPA